MPATTSRRGASDNDRSAFETKLAPPNIVKVIVRKPISKLLSQRLQIRSVVCQPVY